MNKESDFLDNFSKRILQLIQDLQKAKSHIDQLEEVLKEQKVLNEKYKNTIEQQTKVITELSSRQVANNNMKKEKELLKKQIQEYILNIDESIQWFTNNPFSVLTNEENKS